MFTVLPQELLLYIVLFYNKAIISLLQEIHHNHKITEQSDTLLTEEKSIQLQSCHPKFQADQRIWLVNHHLVTDYVLCVIIERFSFECRKVIGFAFTTLRDWLKRLSPLFHQIRSKTKTSCNALACIFPRFASATCNYFEF